MPTMAADQRAAVELVLRQGRSYGELSELLGMPEETIRARARGGLTALAPDLPVPARANEIADWLLGQQAEAHAARTRELLLNDPAANRWAATVAGELRALPGGEAVPELPTGTEKAVEPHVNGTSLRKEPVGPPVTAAGPPTVVGPEKAAPPAPAEPAPAPGRSSRLGGALLIAAAAVIVAGVLAFVFLRGGDDDNATPEPTVAASTPTAAPSTQGANDIVLRGPAGSKAVGLMRLFQANDGSVRFALAAQDVEPNKTGQTYSLWFSTKDGKSQLLGDVKDAVKDNGQLMSAGPGNEDVEEFPSWFQTYDSVLVTLDPKGAKKPGTVILKGDLPASASTG
jgi:hypothetical protein